LEPLDPARQMRPFVNGVVKDVVSGNNSRQANADDN
jgi:hypothetical protein